MVQEHKNSRILKSLAGDAARKTLIRSNGRLVISIAGRYMGQGLSLAELCQEGVLDLIWAMLRKPKLASRLIDFVN